VKVMVFDDWRSILHFIYGAVAGFLKNLYPEALVLLAAYMIYQLLEYMKVRDQIFGDILEMTLGYFYGDLLYTAVKTTCL